MATRNIRLYSALLVGLIAVIAPIILSAEARSVKTIEVRAEQWDNYTYADGRGYFYELISAIYEPLGYQIVFKFCPWKRCVLDVIQDRADIVIGVYGDESEIGSQIQVPLNPIHLEDNGALFKLSKIPNWSGVESLRNKTIVQIRGYGMEEKLNLPVKVVDVSNLTQGMHILMADRGDFLLGGMEELKREQGTYDNEKRLLKIERVFKTPAFLGYNLGPKGSKLSKEFDQQYAKLYKARIPQQLQKKWNLSWPIHLQEQ